MKKLLFVIVISLTGCSDLYNELGIKSIQLRSRIFSIETQPGVFIKTEKDEYFYNSVGAFINEKHYIFNAQSDTFDLFSTTSYGYLKGQVETITKKFEDNRTSVITAYEYLNGKVSKIHQDDEIDLNANISYLPEGKVEVLYVTGEGLTSTYKFTRTNGNVVFEQTLGSDGRPESESVNEYDDKENPLLLLGYVDILFINASQNNKTKATTKFFFDQKPTLNPLSNIYKYNKFNYPTEVLTRFESTNTTGSSALMKTVYSYN